MSLGLPPLLDLRPLCFTQAVNVLRLLLGSHVLEPRRVRGHELAQEGTKGTTNTEECFVKDHSVKGR